VPASIRPRWIRAARQGFGNDAFEDSEEDTGAIVEEFFPAPEETKRPEPASPVAAPPSKPSLTERLDARTQYQSPSAKAH
jgi:hypothetical protein